MNRSKCPRCGLVNFQTDETCRRCGAQLNAPGESFEKSSGETVEVSEPAPHHRSLVQRAGWVLGMSLTILFIWYLSLLFSSERLTLDQREDVQRAIDILQEKGFGRQAFALRHLASYRATDNWWNVNVGHREAYAATNFPFEVVTLYPEFFGNTVDDNERAVVLLHESYHLFGAGEAAALEGVWREKSRLGWTADKYSRTKVWKNTRELTVNAAPQLFTCGPEGQSDCLP